MKKFLLLFLFVYMLTLPVFAQLEIDLSSSNKQNLLISREYPVVYKPSKLIIGQENSFKVKAAPGNSVSLMISASNSGANPFYGKTLRLGLDPVTVKGIVPENGIIEIKFNLPNQKDLNGKVSYFEVAVWKSEDYKDVRIAKIMDEDCRETNSNQVDISLPPQDVSKPSFGPSIPMIPPEFMKTIDAVENAKTNKNSKNDYSDYMYENPFMTPAYIRNLNAPELINPPVK
ncbi:MAG: hypothetical protein PHC34_01185 [Candidatus Gastranaerophilales bacterium]|nr:hypothetical protein [Candidatus Gastranaerophilales bacterium]